jgi:hypothetical protein
MASPERLNVLLSRARNALIMIGNASTFIGSHHGGALWMQLFDMLRANGHFFSGLPVSCTRHPSRTVILQSPEDFEALCPDGGCSERW